MVGALRVTFLGCSVAELVDAASVDACIFAFRGYSVVEWTSPPLICTFAQGLAMRDIARIDVFQRRRA